MRIAIVNDMILAVEALRRVVTSRPDLSIAWVALDGQEAVDKCAADRPDIILMDLIMPVMNGVEATRRIMRDSPCAILVVTATVQGNISLVFEAMGCGALDAVQTPVLGPGGHISGGADLLARIGIVGQL
ncbi:MAG: response regulator, partial [Acidobacteriota bacterium]